MSLVDMLYVMYNCVFVFFCYVDHCVRHVRTHAVPTPRSYDLPAACVVVEDSTVGVRAGVAAGMRVIGFCGGGHRSEEHTSELQSLMRLSYAVFCVKKNNLPNVGNQQRHNLFSELNLIRRHHQSILIQCS